MILNFRKRERQIEKKEDALKNQKQQFHRKVNKDIRQLQKINDILANGIVLEIKKGLGNPHV